MAIKQLTVFVENRQGTLVTVTDTLSKHNINLRALSIAETQDFGILRLIVDKPEEVVVTEEQDGNTLVLVLSVASDDMGKVIGKHGKIAKSIRRVMKSAAGNCGRRVDVEIR